jgi:hypothetical protein
VCRGRVHSDNFQSGCHPTWRQQEEQEVQVGGEVVVLSVEEQVAHHLEPANSSDGARHSGRRDRQPRSLHQGLR